MDNKDKNTIAATDSGAKSITTQDRAKRFMAGFLAFILIFMSVPTELMAASLRNDKTYKIISFIIKLIQP